jgi:hypothetical protein
MTSTPTPGIPLSPEQFWETVSVAQAVVWIVAAFAVLVFVVKAWPFIRNMFNILDALVQLPKYMSDTTERLESIHHEVNYNNGSSVKDAIVRVESGTKGLHIRMDEQDEKLQEIVERFDETIQETKERLANIEDTHPPRDYKP